MLMSPERFKELAAAEPTDISVLACNPKYIRYIVMNRSTHFEVINRENGILLECTHGAWRGELISETPNEDNEYIVRPKPRENEFPATAEMTDIAYRTMEYTHLDSYEACVKVGLIDDVKS